MSGLPKPAKTKYFLDWIVKVVTWFGWLINDQFFGSQTEQVCDQEPNWFSVSWHYAVSSPGNEKRLDLHDKLQSPSARNLVFNIFNIRGMASVAGGPSASSEPSRAYSFRANKIVVNLHGSQSAVDSRLLPLCAANPGNWTALATSWVSQAPGASCTWIIESKQSGYITIMILPMHTTL